MDSPEIVRPKQRKNVLVQAVGAAVWTFLFLTALGKGREYGLVEAESYRKLVTEEKALTAQNEKIMQESFGSKVITLERGAQRSVSQDRILADVDGVDRNSENSAETVNGSAAAVAYPQRGLAFERSKSASSLIEGGVIDEVIVSQVLARLNVGEVENMILAIYARHGAEFESASAQNWANQQPWYRRVTGRTIKDAEKEFNVIAQHNVRHLVERWNKLQKDEGQPPVPVDKSPLAGRAVSPDLEADSDSSAPAVLKALPVDESPPARQGNLNSEEIEGRDVARVRSEINTIYARHGVVFPNKELQAWASQQPWYKPDPGLTFDEAEKQCSVDERHDIEVLASRRDSLLGKVVIQRALPVSESLNSQLIATWDASRVRTEINSVYARYGVDFPNRELQSWADKQPGYKRIPGRTFDDVDLLLDGNDRSNIELLAARRTQINSRKE